MDGDCCQRNNVLRVAKWAKRPTQLSQAVLKESPLISGVPPERGDRCYRSDVLRVGTQGASPRNRAALTRTRSSLQPRRGSKAEGRFQRTS